MHQTTTETDALVRALSTVAGNLPIAILQLREGEMPRDRQHSFGSLLIELGALIQQHAELSAPPTEVGRDAPAGS